jgi:hypothetical protein
MVVWPKHLESSFLFQRLSREEPFMKMPPLGRNVVDEEAVQMVEQWIQSLPEDDQLFQRYRSRINGK